MIRPAKEKVFVSPNFHKLTAREICAICQIPLTADLGKYDGVPLIYKRVSKTTYYHILEKVQDRLAGWKATSNSSYTWRSLFRSQKLLKKGTSWIVEDGKTRKFWKERSMDRGPTVVSLRFWHYTG